MAMQIDNLMALIEGKRKEKGGEPKPFFTKLSVEDIESKTRNLFRECQSFRVSETIKVFALSKIFVSIDIEATYRNNSRSKGEASMILEMKVYKVVL